MKTNTKTQILNNGTVREKTNLFMEDIAMRNIAYDFENPFLTEADRLEISESIKSPKDVKYYNQLVGYNKAYLMYKPYLTIYKTSIQGFYQNIEKYLVEMELNSNFNSIIEEIKSESDTITAEKIVTVLNRHHKKIAYIDDNLVKIDAEIQKINSTAETVNLFFAEIKYFLKKYLPLKPYIQFTNEEEQSIIETLKEIIKKTSELPITKVISYKANLGLTNKQGIENIIKASK